MNTDNTEFMHKQLGLILQVSLSPSQPCPSGQ